MYMISVLITFQNHKTTDINIISKSIMDVLRKGNYIVSPENSAGPRVSLNSPLSVHMQ